MKKSATPTVPGAKLCDLAVPDRFVDSAVNWSTPPPHTFLAPDCADDVLAASTDYWVVFSDMDHVEYEVEYAEEPDVRDYGSGWDLIGYGKRGAINVNVWSRDSAPKMRGGLWAKEN